MCRGYFCEINFVFFLSFSYTICGEPCDSVPIRNKDSKHVSILAETYLFRGPVSSAFADAHTCTLVRLCGKEKHPHLERGDNVEGSRLINDR